MSKKSGPKSMSTLTGGQKQVSQTVGDYLNPRIGQGSTPYTGQLTAPMNSQFSSILQQLQNWRPASMPNSNSLSQALSGRPAWLPNLDPTQTANYYNQAVATPLLRQYDSQIAPRIRESFGGVGAFSSREGDALRQALTDTQGQISQGLGQAQLSNQQMQAQMTGQAYQQAGQNQLSAWNSLVNSGLQYAQQGLSSIGMQTGLAQAFQGNQQQQLDAQYKEFLRQLPEQSPWLQYAMGYTGQQQNQIVNQPGWLDQAMGIVGGGLGMMSGIGALGGGLGGMMGGIGSMFGSSNSTYGTVGMNNKYYAAMGGQ